MKSALSLVLTFFCCGTAWTARVSAATRSPDSQTAAPAGIVRAIDVAADVQAMKAFCGEHYFATADGILRYDRHGALLNSIGRKGLGPGEFEIFIHFGFCRDGIFVSDIRKTAVFTLDGALLREQPNPSGAPVAALSGGTAVSIARDMSRDDPSRPAWVHRIVLRDLVDGTERTLLSETLPLTPGFDFEAIEPVFQVRCDLRSERFHVSNPGQGTIDVFSPAGDRLTTVRLDDLGRVEVDKAFMEEFYGVIFRDPRFGRPEVVEKMKKAIHFPRLHPFFHSFFVDEDGRLLVRTLRKRGASAVWHLVKPGGARAALEVLEDAPVDVTAAERFFDLDGGVLWQLSTDDEGNYRLRSCRIGG